MRSRAAADRCELADGYAPFILAVASGKGGTGKTLVATNLAVLWADAGLSVLLADCDVEAPNSHLFLPARTDKLTSVESKVARPDSQACNACGTCSDLCAFGAVRILGGTPVVFEEICHGCGVCVSSCPTGAMGECSLRVGEVSTGVAKRSQRLRLVTGRLDIGQVKAPSLIGATREEAERWDADILVLDAPPGVACSAVAAVRHADALLLVTEPTAFGLHDLELSLMLGSDMGLPIGVVVNRDGSGPTDIAEFATAQRVDVVGRIPFDRRIAEVYARGGLIVDELPEATSWLRTISSWIEDVAEGSAPSAADGLRERAGR